MITAPRRVSVHSRIRIVVAGVVALVVGVGAGLAHHMAEPAEQAGSADQAAELVRLKDEIERLKGMVPDQSHVMKDVAYHFSNLWFAGQAQNWPLAGFYLDETRSHLRWAVRIRPVRRTAAGEVDLRSILDGLERSLLTGVQKTIDARDLAAFSKAYRDTLTGCYACHQASEKPYLRPHVPEAPEGRMIDFSPTASGQ
jgi:hypothetical protein